MKIYTKGGDKGLTSLIGGERVYKTDERVEAYGTVDELTAFTALLADKIAADADMRPHVEMLRRIESRLMTVEALLATGEGGRDKTERLQCDATELEREIDAMQERLPAIDKFSVPGGDERVSPSGPPCAPLKYTRSTSAPRYISIAFQTIFIC